MGAVPDPRAEISVAKSCASNIATRLALGEVPWKRRRQFQTTIRALRFYAAALQFEIDRGAAPAIQEVGSERANARCPKTDLRSASNVLHATDRKAEGSHEDANPIHPRTNSLQGSEHDDRRHR